MEQKIREERFETDAEQIDHHGRVPPGTAATTDALNVSSSRSTRNGARLALAHFDFSWAWSQT